MFGCGDDTTPTACTSISSRSKNHPRDFEDSNESLLSTSCMGSWLKNITKHRYVFDPKNGRFFVFKFQHKKIGVHFSPILGWGEMSSFVIFLFLFKHCVTLLFLPPTTSEVNPSPRHPVIFSNNDWYVQSPPKRIVLRFHYPHSQFRWTRMPRDQQKSHPNQTKFTHPPCLPPNH